MSSRDTSITKINPKAIAEEIEFQKIYGPLTDAEMKQMKKRTGDLKLDSSGTPKWRTYVNGSGSLITEYIA